MKFKNTIYILLLTLLFASCELDRLVCDMTSAEEVTLNVGIKTKASTGDTNVLGVGESEISTLRVYAFEADGTFDCMKYFGAPLVGNIYEMKVTWAPTKDLYFIVNEPSSLSSSLANIKSVADLKAAEVEIADFLTKNGFNQVATFDSFNMPMSAEELGVNATGSNDIEVVVDRVVARVDLYLDMDANGVNNGDKLSLTQSTTFGVSNINNTTTIFASEIPDLEDVTLSSLSGVAAEPLEVYSEANRVLSFYIAEREYNYAQDPITITIANVEFNGETKSIEITLGDTEDSLTSELSEINRNTVYKITATYQGDEPELKSDYEILKWDEVVVDGDLGGVILIADGIIAMDWFRNGYSYVYDDAAFGGDRDITISLPQSRDSDGTFIYPEGGSLVLTSSQRSALATNLLNLTNYDNNTSWLKSAELISLATTGYCTFEYVTQSVDVTCEEFPIRIQSENIVKTMRVIYDNGYIDQSKIPESPPILPDEPADELPSTPVEAVEKPTMSVTEPQFTDQNNWVLNDADYQAYIKACDDYYLLGIGDEPDPFEVTYEYKGDAINNAAHEYLAYIQEKAVYDAEYAKYIEYQNYITLKAAWDAYNSYDSILAEYEAKYQPLIDFGVDLSWTNSVTNGVVLAKRGENKHPMDTEEVFFAGDDELYHDEHAVATLEEAVAYCNQFKSESGIAGVWYLPSKDLMMMVQMNGTELGTSYRFQNSDGTAYWCADGTVLPMAKSLINNYWAAYTIGGKDGATAEKAALAPQQPEAGVKYQVRCMLNM